MIRYYENETAAISTLTGRALQVILLLTVGPSERRRAVSNNMDIPTSLEDVASKGYMRR